jgi:hypothetical protein
LDLTQTTQPFSCRALPPELMYVEYVPVLQLELRSRKDRNHARTTRLPF